MTWREKTKGALVGAPGTGGCTALDGDPPLHPKTARLNLIKGDQMENITTVVNVPVEDLFEDAKNRKVGGYDKAKLSQLAESIKAVGVQQPAVVRRAGDKFEIVAGVRRWMATKLAGLETLPCIVRKLDDFAVLKIRIIENLQREDVHPLDEADGYARLLDRDAYDVEHLAQEVGKSVSYVYQRLKLRDLIAPVREMLVNGKLTAGHAIMIARLQPDQQTIILNKWTDGTSIRELDEFIREQILMDLSKTAFKKDDADLVPRAGSCSTCMKRSGAQTSLFADVCKKDYCLDPKCFQAKLDALVARGIKQLAGQPHLLVSEEYASPNDMKKLPKGTVVNHDWTECKQKDKGAVRCLVVDSIGRGRMTWGIKDEDQSLRYQPSPQEKAAAERKRREMENKRIMRRKVWDAIFEKLESTNIEGSLPTELLRIVVLKSWARLWHDSKRALAKVEGWKMPEKFKDYDKHGRTIIAKLVRHGLLIFLAKIELIATLDVKEYYDADEKNLYAAARVLKLNARDIASRAAVARKASKPEKKATAKNKTNGKE